MRSRWIITAWFLWLLVIGVQHLHAAPFNGMPAVDVLGQTNFTSSAAATTQTGLSFAASIAVDSVHNRLFVADGSNSRILVYPLNADGTLASKSASNVIGQANFTTGTNHTIATASGFNIVFGIAYDATHNRLFASDYRQGRVLVFDVSSITNGMSASYVLGADDFTHFGSVDDQSHMIGRSNSVTYDAVHDRLFVSCGYSARVMVFDLSSGISNGMNASYVLGQPDFTTGTYATTQSGIWGFPNGPGTIAYDSVSNRLFLPDPSNNRVLVFDLSFGISNGMNASYVLGQANFTSNGAATTQSGMSSPYSTLYDPTTKRLFVNDTINNRTLVFDLSSGISNGMNASYVLGQTSFTSSTAATTQSTLRGNREGLAFDSLHRWLYVSDSGNNRVLIFRANPASISGIAYADEGHTTLGAGRNVVLSVGGAALTGSGYTNSSGQYTINLLTNMTGGSLAAVYLNNGSEKAAAATITSDSIAGLDLYQNHLIVRSDSGSVAITNAQIGAAAANGDTDLSSIYTVTSNALSVKSGNALTIWSGGSFSPGGNIAAGSGVTINGTVTLAANTLTLSGSWLNTGTFSANGGTVIFNGTGLQTLTPGNSSLPNVLINKTSGVLLAPATTLSISGNFTRNSGTFTANGGTVLLSGTNQTLSGSITFSTLIKTPSGADTLTVHAGDTIGGKLLLQGPSTSNRLNLRSTTTNGLWILAAADGGTFGNLDVKDGNNTGSRPIDCVDCNNSGNNIRWLFSNNPSQNVTNPAPSSGGSNGGGGGGGGGSTYRPAATQSTFVGPGVTVIPIDITPTTTKPLRSLVEQRKEARLKALGAKSVVPESTPKTTSPLKPTIPSILPTAGPLAPKLATGTYQIIDTPLNLRGDSRLNATIKQLVPLGTTLTVLNVVDQFAHVQLANGKTGYLLVKHLRKVSK